MASLGWAADEGFNGRWNIQVQDEARNRAWWLEVTGAGTPAPKGRFVGAPGGGMDDVPNLSVRNGELSFSFNRKYGDATRGNYRARLVGGKLQGIFEAGPQKLKWTGTRAPLIKDRDDGSWKEGNPVQLFNGKDLSGWVPVVAGRELGWTVKDGLMTNVAGANNLQTTSKFWNFKLHVEYRLGERSNSGIGLRGRYEVQILDDYGRPPNTHTNGALYSRIPPRINASRKPGEWQTFDIGLVGRQVTVVLNGTSIIDKGEIEGLTAVATDPNEAEPGPISIQGDHGPVEIRSLVLTPLIR
jgi:hypothetical protein